MKILLYSVLYLLIGIIWRSINHHLYKFDNPEYKSGLILIWPVYLVCIILEYLFYFLLVLGLIIYLILEISLDIITGIIKFIIKGEKK